jgi:hypothetical protein
MNAEMMDFETRLTRLMREILERWPESGIMLIMKAERAVIQEDASAIAGWAESQRRKEKAPGS